jgi:hypothetical protein
VLTGLAGVVAPDVVVGGKQEGGYVDPSTIYINYYTQRARTLRPSGLRYKNKTVSMAHVKAKARSPSSWFRPPPKVSVRSLWLSSLWT